MSRIKNFIGASLVALMAAIVPQGAMAGQIEAIWNVKLRNYERDKPSGTNVPLTVPQSFQIRTVFSDQPNGIEKYGSDTIMTRFNEPGGAVFEHNLMSVMATSLTGSPNINGADLRALTYDYPTHFSDATTIGMSADETVGDLSWYFLSDFWIRREGETRNGDGTSAFAFTYDYLESYLLDYKENPYDYSSIFLQTYTVFDKKNGKVVSGRTWLGEVTLDSLRRLDAADVPEPAAIALFGVGLAGAAALGRRKRSAGAAAEAL